MKIERSVEIPAPAAAIWRIAHDADQRAKWDVRVADYALSGPLEAGASVRMAWRASVMSAVAEGRFRELEAPHLAVVDVDGATLPIFPPGTVTWRLEQVSGGTRFTSRFEARDEDCAAPGWLIAFVLKRDLKRSLQNLKQLVHESLNAPSGYAVESEALAS